jgi:hypothetical protein
VILAIPAPETVHGLVRVMSPTAVFVLLLAALVVDYMSIGPNSLRDRLAFLMGMTAIRQGFDGSPLDRWTVEQLTGIIEEVKNGAKGAYIAGAVTSQLLGAAVLILAIFAVGCLMPDRFSKKLGRFASMSFPSTGIHRMNYKLWACAFFIGLLADLPQGSGGNVLRMLVDLVGKLMSFIPISIFGVTS